MEEILDKLQIFIIITLQKFKHISYSDHFHLLCPKMGGGELKVLNKKITAVCKSELRS